MRKFFLTPIFLCFFVMVTHAQLGAMKLVGSDSKNYKLGFGAFIKTGFPAFTKADITLEVGLNYFASVDGDGLGTVMCPLKAGYRYLFKESREGFYVEPQIGYNLYGITSLLDENGQTVDLKYHGVVFAAGGGYLFGGKAAIDLNLRYETVIAHGGSNNLISLGITRAFSFGKKN